MKWRYFHIKQTAFQENVHTHVPGTRLFLQGCGQRILRFAYKAPSDLPCNLGSNNTWQDVSLHPLWPNKRVKSAEEMKQGLISHLRYSSLQDSPCCHRTTQLSSVLGAWCNRVVFPGVSANAAISSLYQRGPQDILENDPLGFCLPSSPAIYINVTDIAVQVCSAYPIVQWMQINTCQFIGQ